AARTRDAEAEMLIFSSEHSDSALLDMMLITGDARLVVDKLGLKYSSKGKWAKTQLNGKT
ncbi:MAG: hypothetical protein RR091_10800, partial [Cloacibacillus sp.]